MADLRPGELTERWRPHPIYTLYMVSDMGRVKGPHGKILKPAYPHGYARISVSIRGQKHRGASVHVMVLETFKSMRPDGLQVAHLNGDRKDNRLVNLRWVTAAENAEHRDAHGTTALGERHGCAKLTERQVKDILASKDPSRAIAKRYGLEKTMILLIRRGKYWKHISRAAAIEWEAR